ncbi:MAG TPA: hypothetical protein VGM77_10705 [Gemmatimonadales bacterium]
MLRRALIGVGATVLMVAGLQPAAAQRARDTVFIVPGGHLDVGFTAPIDSVRVRRIAIIDAAMRAAHADPGFRWFEEGGWSVEAWLDQYHNNPSHIADLRALIRRGQIGVGATMLSPYAAAFPEALHLLTMHLDRVERELGTRPDVAVVNDVPAVPEAMVDALAAAGVHYLLMGPNLFYSRPLPISVTRDPFYWESSKGARVLVAIDPEGYGAAFAKWLLPPDCVRAANPSIPSGVPDAEIFNAGVARELAAMKTTQPLSIIQHAIDNGDPLCALHLDAAVAEWNRQPGATKLVVSMPDVFFHHLEARRKASLRVLRGEWGGDWDLLRASEPVWTWRLHTALRAINATTPASVQREAVTVIDHNVGLGTRWMDGLPAATAREHIAEVASLYRRVVGAVLGPGAATALPARLALPPSGAWPAAWQSIVGDRRQAAVVRAGVSFIRPFVPADAPIAAIPVEVAADQNRLVVHTTIDRIALERTIGPKYQAVLEVEIHAPRDRVTLAPVNSPAARAGRWLMGTPPDHVVAPDGVIIAGPGWSIRAWGPLLYGWSLVADPHNPGMTRLQALALVHSVQGTVTNGEQLRLPFAAMYPGEPPAPSFDLELTREVAGVPHATRPTSPR